MDLYFGIILSLGILKYPFFHKMMGSLWRDWYMLFLRSFLGKIKRWPNLCWASKKQKEGGLPKHCQMSDGGKNHLWLRITGVEWKLELSKQKREDGRIVMRHGIIVEENLSWPGAGAAKGHSWWPSGSPFRSKLDCGTGDPSHARYTAFWTWALLIRQTVGLCPQKEKGI